MSPEHFFPVPPLPEDADAEKRAFQRLLKTYSVTLAKLSFPMPKEQLAANCYDISKGGICLAMAEDAFDVGDVCQVNVTIPLLNKYAPGFYKVYENDAEQYFTALAEVAWSGTQDGKVIYGLKFVNVHGDQMAALEKLIERTLAGLQDGTSPKS